MGGCQNAGPFLDPSYGTAPNYLGFPKRDHNVDDHPHPSAPQPKGSPSLENSTNGQVNLKQTRVQLSYYDALGCGFLREKAAGAW